MNAMNVFIMFAVSAVVLFVATVVWQIIAVRSIFGNVSKMDLNKLNSNKVHSIGFEKFMLLLVFGFQQLYVQFPVSFRW